MTQGHRESDAQPPGHEPKRTRVKVVFGVAIGLAIVIVAVGAAVAWLANLYREIDSSRRSVTPEPRVRIETGRLVHEEWPGQQLEQMRSRAVERLTSYGWVDKSRNVAHVPIDRAMELYLDRLRRPGEPPAHTPPEPTPGEGSADP